MIPGLQDIQAALKSANEIFLDEFTKFKAYWNANGANYDAVKLKYTTDAEAASAAVIAA